MTQPRTTGWRAEGPCLDWVLWRRDGRYFWVDMESDVAALDSVDEQTTGVGLPSVRVALASARNAMATHIYDPRMVGRKPRGWRKVRPPAQATGKDTTK